MPIHNNFQPKASTGALERQKLIQIRDTVAFDPGAMPDSRRTMARIGR